MASLPKKYMRVVRDLTAYWGTYLPSLHLSPGMIGEIEDGVFTSSGTLGKFAEYDPSSFPVVEQARDDASTQWATKAVSMEVFRLDAAAPAEIAKGGVRLRFSQADEAAILCNGVRTTAFDDIDAVKDLLRQLRAAGKWRDSACLVTDVGVVGSAWLCYSTEAGQAAEITASAPIALPAAPLDALTALAGRASLSASTTLAKSSAICVSLPNGGTPLFRAIQFNPTWLGLGKPSLGFVKGETAEFQEPSFGELGS